MAVRFPDYGLYRAAGTTPEDELLVWGSHLRALQVYFHELDAEARRIDGSR